MSENEGLLYKKICADGTGNLKSYQIAYNLFSYLNGYKPPANTDYPNRQWQEIDTIQKVLAEAKQELLKDSEDLLDNKLQRHVLTIDKKTFKKWFGK